MRLKMKDKISHGWYSKKQAALGGVVRYKTPSGKIVEVSAVADDIRDAPNWDDAIYVGEVTDCLERISEGALSVDMDDSPEEILRKIRIINGDDPPIDKSKLN